MNILVKISGSIAAYKMCSVVSTLVKEGHSVKVIASDAALNFVGSATFEALSHNKVFTDDFEPGRRLDHIYLNDWAELVILSPASAQTLNSISTGVGSNSIVTAFLSRKKETPYLIFPAMNPRMWDNYRVKDSIKNLESTKGIKVFYPSSGLMACGHVGEGRLLEPNEILDVVYKEINKDKDKVLISLGGTYESIDGVREICNFSTGRTGLDFIKALRNSFNLHVLASNKSKSLLENEYGFKVDYFSGVLDLEEKMKAKLSSESYKKVFHLAAVSDYLVSDRNDKKISSNLESIVINMKKAPKILGQLKSWSINKDVEIISFKLSHNESEEEVLEKIRNQFDKSSSDLIVHNELTDINHESHEFKIYSKDIDLIKKGKTKKELTDFFATQAGGQ